MNQIADPNSFVLSKHFAVINAFRSLLIDLRIERAGLTPQEAGWHPEPITPERLDRLSLLLNTLQDCRDESARIKY